MDSSSSPQWIEYPDPVVAAYLERVQSLTPRAREYLNPPFWPMLKGAPLRELPRVLLDDLIHRVNKWAAMRIAVIGCDDPITVDRYRRFFAALKKQGWSSGGRAMVAGGLFALRSRAQDPVAARAMYPKAVDAVVPRHALGWYDAPTA